MSGESEEQRRKIKRGGKQEGGEGREKTRKQTDSTMRSDLTTPITDFPRVPGGGGAKYWKGGDKMEPGLCRMPKGLHFLLQCPAPNSPGGEGSQPKSEKGHLRSGLEYFICSSSPNPLRKHRRAFTGKSTSPSPATDRTRSPGGTARGELR